MKEEAKFEVSRIHRLNKEDSKLKAFVDVSLAGLVVKGLRIVEGKNGLFVGMPRQQGQDGKWYESVSTESEELKERIAEVVLKAYKE